MKCSKDAFPIPGRITHCNRTPVLHPIMCATSHSHRFPVVVLLPSGETSETYAKRGCGVIASFASLSPLCSAKTARSSYPRAPPGRLATPASGSAGQRRPLLGACSLARAPHDGGLAASVPLASIRCCKPDNTAFRCTRQGLLRVCNETCVIRLAAGASRASVVPGSNARIAFRQARPLLVLRPRKEPCHPGKVFRGIPAAA